MMKHLAALLCLYICIVAFSFSAFAGEPPSIASRTINNQTYFYPNLHEAFEAASGISFDNPDKIILLTDCVLDQPIIIEDGKHIQLVSGDANVTIQRGKANLEYPLFWLKGNNASFCLGKADMTKSLVVDGGYLQSPPIEALAPLVAVNGLYSKFIMYDNVSLQNNYSVSDTDGTHAYRNGAGVFIRTYEGNQESQAEFIMKGGIIQGNFNNNQNPIPFGGGILITGFGVFTMEGGIIMNNTTFRGGGGFHAGSRASFYKTGGIIYGKNAPEGFRNIAINGGGDPKFYGHALSIPLVEAPLVQYRNDTVGENDHLSYIGSPTSNGIFGKGENWDTHAEEIQTRLIIILFSVLLLVVICYILFRRKRWKLQLLLETQNANISVFGVNLSPREKEILEMLLSGKAIKEIAFGLGISYSGTNFHVKNLYTKLGIKNHTELLIKYSKSS
jgi:DNA-binding CsgD family transcriptional regulator